ncbi:MAG TPA: hypothetical protein VL860_10665, partial [Planctomycetota bacterium]|nr:hypothetical protein [Planctomycetota bacterium]
RLSQNRTAKRKRLEELLLLIIRMLALACLALALAGPFLGSSGIGKDSEPRAVAIVLDTSYSMQLTEGPAGRKHTRLEVAQRLAGQTLDGLVNDQSQACLIPASPQWENSDTAGSTVGTPPSDAAASWANAEALSGRIDRVRDFVWQTKASGAPADLKAAVEKALKQLDACPIRHKELYIVSDLQRADWEPLLAALDKHLVSDVQAAVLDVRELRAEDRDDQHNLAVEDLTLTSRQKLIGSPVIVAGRLRNYSDREIRTRVSWDWGRLPGGAGPETAAPAPGTSKSALPASNEYQPQAWLSQNHAEKDLTLPPHSTADVTFETVFREQGSYAGRLAAGSDSLGIDNARYAVYRVSDQIPVAVVPSPREHVFYQSGAFYLQSALDPFGTGDAKGRRSSFAVKLLKPQDLGNSDLSGYAAVILAGVDSITPDQLIRLRAYLENGGGLVVFPAEGGNYDGLTQQLGVREETDMGPGPGLLPGRFAERFGDPTDEEKGESIRIQEHDHPALAAFRGRFADLLSAVVVRAGLDLRIADTSSARTLLSTSSGRPIMASVRIGRGEVIQWATSCDGRWGNLAITNFFPVALHDMVLAMSNANTGGVSQSLGQMSVRGADLPPGSLTVCTPEGLKINLAHTSLKPAAWRAVTPGFYEAIASGATPGQSSNPRELYAANIDAAQSDLATVSPESVTTTLAWCGGGRGVVLGQGGGPEAGSDVIRTLRSGYRASRDLLLLSLFLFLIELILAERFFRATGAAPVTSTAAVASPPTVHAGV